LPISAVSDKVAIKRRFKFTHLLHYFTLRGKHRLRVFENEEQRKVFGPKSEEATMEWIKRHNEGFNSYSSSNIIWVIKSWKNGGAGHVNLKGEM
jgi:hypothetical protein